MKEEIMRLVVIMLTSIMPASLFSQEVKRNDTRLDSVPTESRFQEPIQPVMRANASAVANVKPEMSEDKPPVINSKATEIETKSMPYLARWNGGGMYGYHGSIANITSFRNMVGINAFEQWGNMSLAGGMNVSHGLANGIGVVNGFGGELALGYVLSDNVSVTAVGGMNKYGFLTPAPNITSAYYGGYFTLKTNNGKWGMDLGVRRIMNPMTGRWETVPIAMPYYNLNGQKLGLDVGGILYSLFRSTAESVNKPGEKEFMNDGRGPAIIAPPIDTKVTFGTQEIPKWMEKQFEKQ